MKREQMYEELLKLRPQINKRLQHLNFLEIKELVLWLAKSEIYQRLKIWDNQLRMLDFFCKTWLEEKRRLPQIGIEDDIFYGINSLEDIERKYLSIYFGAMRFETIMPKEYYDQVIDTILDYRISGIALKNIIIGETAEWKKNTIAIASLLKEKGELVTAIILLEETEKISQQNEDIILALADCWMSGQQWNKAMECLKKITTPHVSIQKLTIELEKKISNEDL